MPEINEQLITALVLVSVVTFVGTLLIVPWMLVRIPSDYFVRTQRTPLPVHQRHPVLRLVLLILKNMLGVVLLLGGFAMLFIPGQGLLTIVMGLMLINFPGKYRLERWLIQRRNIHRPINWIRHKRGRDPIEVPG